MFEKEIEELKNAGIKPSKQRIKILKYFNEHTDRHNTVEEIFRDFRQSDDSLSLATIYNTINLFKEKKLISSVELAKGESRYERNMTDHIHFECRICGEIYNMEISISDEFAKKYGDFEIEKQYVLLNGICPECK
ncbi:MAG: Fur family transcriptional regulator [Erysipelotrichaceae bacterium]|nr:Fur family transcriptional regulator [Erysipelotrichaceae bacterium]